MWNNTAHEGMLKSLKQNVHCGISMFTRIQSEHCSEMRLCALYFTQNITKKEFKDGMRRAIMVDHTYNAFLIALRRLRTEKHVMKLVSSHCGNLWQYIQQLSGGLFTILHCLVFITNNISGQQPALVRPGGAKRGAHRVSYEAQMGNKI